MLCLVAPPRLRCTWTVYCSDTKEMYRPAPRSLKCRPSLFVADHTSSTATPPPLPPCANAGAPGALRIAGDRSPPPPKESARRGQMPRRNIAPSAPHLRPTSGKRAGAGGALPCYWCVAWVRAHGRPEVLARGSFQEEEESRWPGVGKHWSCRHDRPRTTSLWLSSRRPRAFERRPRVAPSTCPAAAALCGPDGGVCRRRCGGLGLGPGASPEGGGRRSWPDLLGRPRFCAGRPSPSPPVPGLGVSSVVGRSLHGGARHRHAPEHCGGGPQKAFHGASGRMIMQHGLDVNILELGVPHRGTPNFRPPLLQLVEHPRSLRTK